MSLCSAFSEHTTTMWGEIEGEKGNREKRREEKKKIQWDFSLSAMASPLQVFFFLMKIFVENRQQHEKRKTKKKRIGGKSA